MLAKCTVHIIKTQCLHSRDDSSPGLETSAAHRKEFLKLDLNGLGVVVVDGLENVCAAFQVGHPWLWLVWLRIEQPPHHSDGLDVVDVRAHLVLVLEGIYFAGEQVMVPPLPRLGRMFPLNAYRQRAAFIPVVEWANSVKSRPPERVGLSICPDFEYELVGLVLTRPHWSVEDVLRMTGTGEVLSGLILLEDAHFVVGIEDWATLLGRVICDSRFGSPEFRHRKVHPVLLDLMAVSQRRKSSCSMDTAHSLNGML